MITVAFVKWEYLISRGERVLTKCFLLILKDTKRSCQRKRKRFGSSSRKAGRQGKLNKCLHRSRTSALT